LLNNIEPEKSREESTVNKTCSCPCGKSQFQVLAYPFARFICHCNICQELYNAPFADATVLWWRDIILPNDHDIQFKKYRAFPGIDRGICSDCKSPIIASMGFGAARLALTAARNFPNINELIEPKMHIFYNHRVSDAADDLSKYSGYLKSEVAVVSLIARGMLNRKRPVR